MEIIHTLAHLHDYVARAGKPVLVPTMGNLHAGHIALVERALAISQSLANAPVMASIFVNRLQFAPHEDFGTYPRTLAADCAQLSAVGCHAVFAPTEEVLYPEPQGFRVTPAPELATILEGHFRPGFFDGVCTVVLKLFGATQCQAAVFGKKDYQQQTVIRRMVAQFNLPVRIELVETTREASGLALSSRNGYLSPEQKMQATELAAALRHAAKAYCSAANPLAARSQIEADAMAHLQQRGWLPDYLTIRRQDNLLAPLSANDAVVALAAARIGNTRLIDNFEVSHS